MDLEHLKKFVALAKAQNVDEKTINELLLSHIESAKPLKSVKQEVQKVSPETEDYLAMEFEEELREAGRVYYPSSLIQATLPHKAHNENEFQRINGNLSLSILAPSSVGGLPYGVPPRLIIMYITSLVKKYKSREIIFGRSIRNVLNALNVPITSGARGNVKRYHDQLKRLSATTFSVIQEFESNEIKNITIQNKTLFDEAQFWWDSNFSHAEAWATLSNDFFEVLSRSGVPLSKEAIIHLSKSPIALDIYCWLTYKLRLIKRQYIVPWDALKMQLGAEYKEIKTFKFNFIKAMKDVLQIYQDANVEESSKGLILRPSKSHVPEIIK